MTDTSANKPRISRSTFIRTILYGTAGLSLSALGGALYTTRLEPWWLKIERIQVPIRNLPVSFEGYRLVQLSDLHIHDEQTRDNVVNAIQMALELEPDMIVVTGDYVTNVVDHTMIIGAIRSLTAPDGVFTIMGNHDHWTDVDAVRQVVSEAGIQELRNESVAIMRGNDALWLAGVDDIWEEHHDLDAALTSVPLDSPLILLAHEPDYADQVYPLDRVSLQLSGHSHGGQVNFPIIGAPVVPHLGQKYIRGLRQLGSMWLYTNRGVGNLTPIRLSCRPEVTEITLVRSIE